MKSGTEIFLESIRGICAKITDDELAVLAGGLMVKELNKKDFYLESGKVQKAIGFIAKGLVRSFFIDREGNEITVGFFSEGEYATHYPAFVKQKPSLYFIQCLEPTIMVCLPFENMQSLYDKFQSFEKYGRVIAEEILIQQQSRIESFIFQTAEERYIDFIKRQPTLFNRISLSHLCSSLGIERQTLTRIRHKLARQ